MGGSAIPFRILDQAPQYLLQNGDVNSGGFLYTFENDLTTPKTTYSDRGLTTPNSNPIELDAYGRCKTDVWGDGAYGLEMQDALGVTLWTRNNVEVPGGTDTSLPGPVANEYAYSLDGVTWTTKTVLEVPDPSGLANYMLASDGSGIPVWQQIPDFTPPDPEIVVENNLFRAGVSTQDKKWLEQTGSGSASASGGKTATASITYATAFDAAAYVSIVPTSASSCGTANLVPSWAVTTNSATGFTVTFSTVTGGTSADNYTGSNITSSVPFLWKATGTKTITP